MSGAFPISTSKFSTMGIRSSQNTIISLTDSGKKLARQIDGQRFGFTAKIITAKRNDAYGELMAFIIKQRSGKENFTITFPSYFNAQGSETGTVRVNGSHTAGDTTITVDGHAGDTAGSFKAGDLIKFNHSKVYMIVEDVTPSSNASTLTIEPPLRDALANDEQVNYDNITFTVHLNSDVQEFPTNTIDKDNNILINYEFDVIESL